METHAPPWRTLVVPIGFALLCVVLTLGAFRIFGGSLPLQPEGYRVDVPLPTATNLVAGSDVQMSGVRIGRVHAVARTAGGTARATIEIEPAFAPLRSGAGAIVRTKTLLGEGYLELAPGPVSAAILADGGALRTDRVRRNVQLDEFLEAYPPRTRARFRSLLGGLATAARERAPELNAGLGAAAPLATGVEEVLVALAGEQAALDSVLDRSGTVLDALGRREGALRRAVSAADEVFAATAGRDREITATVRRLPPFLTELRRTAGTLERASGDLGGAVDALQPVATRLDPALAVVARDTPEFTRLFRALPTTLTAARRGLPSLTRVLESAGPALKEIQPATRELLPIIELLGEYRVPSLLGPLANVGALTNGTMVGAGGRIIHRAGGAVTVWNESIGGWIKRLPTNRANPYLRPDGLASLGREPLRSYDCRNTGNPLYVPPTGSGAPPCVTQGPWTYKGETAYYPRLQRAPAE
jgi:phospholipid/cholesterol/gamma-HCH transport system substrate-binding protein